MSQPQLDRSAHRGQHLIQQQLLGLVVLGPLLLSDTRQILEAFLQHSKNILQRQSIELVDGITGVGDLQGILLEAAALARRACR